MDKSGNRSYGSNSARKAKGGKMSRSQSSPSPPRKASNKQK